MLPLGKALSFALSITLPRHRKPEEHFFHLRSGQSYTIQWHLVPTIVGRIAMPQRHHRALLWLWTKVHTTLFQSVLQYFLFSYPRLIIIFTSLCSNTQDTQLSFSSWYQDGTLRSVLSLFSWLYSMRHFPRVTLNDSAICRFRPKQQKQQLLLLHFRKRFSCFSSEKMPKENERCWSLSLIFPLTTGACLTVRIVILFIVSTGSSYQTLLKMGHPRPLFHLFSSFRTNITILTTNICEIFYVHPAPGFEPTSFGRQVSSHNH